MNIDTRVNLNLNLSQRLVMTPMLQQAIKLLQMSRLELVDLVQQEMLENPILDEAEEGIEPRQDTSEEQYQDQQKSIDEDAPDLEQLNNRQEESVNWEDYFDDNPASLGYSGEYESEEDTQTYENILTNSQTLSEYLTWQLQMSQLPEHGLKIGRFLIGQINEDGYIHGEDLNISPSFNIHATHLKPKQLKIYRACVSKALCQKINAEFEREYLSKHLDIPPGGEQGMLANILLQEYYEELTTSDFQQLLRKLQQFILEDFEVLTTCMSELPSQGVEKITGIPKAEIEQGLRIMTALCRELRSIIESHTRVFLQESYEGKLEKLRITPEELYFLEYLLSKLSVEEITYIVSKENASQTPKREQELQVFLEKLQQSYAHIESLQSHKYFLIQLYHVGIHLLLEKFHAGSPTRFQKQFFKLLDITEDDLAQIARKITSRVEEFYKTESRITCEEVDQILRQIQTFAPSGVGARDLKECLTIQANNLEISDTPAMSIITHYLYELEQKHYKKIAENLKISLEDVELAQHIISNMSPKPGADFTSARPEYIIPDLYVYKVDDAYEVVLNEDDLPNLRINPTYKNIIMGNGRDTPNTTKQYVDQKLRSALWFIRSVEQRKRTIYKVGRSIVKFQQEFLEYGISHLKPLVLRDVADDIAMHESTVSRVTTNKYIHTSQGVFELKFFFHSGLETSSGDDISSIAIKKQIKQMIDAEDPRRTLSDKKIENKLKETGIAIARRTIAKYREELNISSSVQRKRQKTLSNG